MRHGDMVAFLDPATYAFVVGIMEWSGGSMSSHGQRVDKKDAGLLQVNTHIQLHEETRVREQLKRLKETGSERLTSSFSSKRI